MNLSLLTTVVATVLLLAVSQASSAQERAGDLKTEEASIETSDGKVIKYELGTIYVPEVRSDPKSRIIGVGFARFRSEDPKAPPMFVLPGGPGSSYLQRMNSSQSAKDQLGQQLGVLLPICDVIYVDQRGFSEHGDVLSAKLTIPARPTDRAFGEEDFIAIYSQLAKDITAEFAETEIDLRGYTVKECAADVAAIRSALEYDKITLNGTSFGSQWSFAVMRQHPEIVARALLSGVEPLDHGYDMPSYVFAAVQRMWRSIEQDDKFKPFLPEGGMAEAARVVIERLERGEYTFKNDSGETIGVFGSTDFPWSNPTAILELYHGNTDRWERQAKSGFRGGSQNFDLIGPLIDTSLAITPERRHRMVTDPATRYLGRSFLAYMATEDTWPTEDVGDDFRTPVVSDIPVLFAQGDWDVKTPLENTFEIAPYFTNSRVIIAERGGHGVLGPIAQELPEVWAEVMEFLRTGDLEGIPTRVTVTPDRTFSLPKLPDETKAAG
jgi:pimeloyl-ACP methyl ester carboxylesterase